MTDGTCYSYGDNNVIYAYPNLSCTNGSILPNFDTTTRETYIIRNGKLIKTRSETISGNFVNYSTVVYNYTNGSIPLIDYSYALLPVCLFILGFFAIVYRWFFRLRA